MLSALPSDVVWVGAKDANPFTCLKIEASKSPTMRSLIVAFALLNAVISRLLIQPFKERITRNNTVMQVLNA